MYKLTRIEQETIILFNEEEEYAHIETFNGKLKRRLRELQEKRPEECTLSTNNEQLVTCDIPKSWIRINPTRILSEAEKKNRSELMKRNIHSKS